MLGNNTTWRLPAVALAVSAALISACGGGGSSSSPANPTTPKSDSLDMSAVAFEDNDTGLPADWYRKGVFLEIFVRSYFDSNGDGYGDFDGLTAKLDYIESLGVKGIWLMPTMSSQDRDHGYAVTDYRGYEQDYGDAASFKRFLDEAHARGIGVIIDYVINHSAAQNPLFLDSVDSIEDKRDWYMWRDDYVYWPQPWGSGDTWHSRNGAYYFGIFWDQMPDFNLQNPDVLDYHYNSQRYWLNLGVDGFRFDAVSHLVEGDDGQLEGHPETFSILKQIQDNVGQYQNRYMVCESPSHSFEMASDDVCGSAFGFGLNYALVNTARTGRLDPALNGYLNQPNLHNTALVLANHDRFAGARLMEQFNGNESRYKMAVASLLTLPGIPFIYYGEEIGMNHNGQGNDWDLRAPMSWTGDNRTGGFTESSPYRDLANNVADYNVEAQQADANSLLNFYKQMIALRNAEPALQTGDLSLLSSNSNSVLSFTRTEGDEELLVVLNYSSSSQSIALNLDSDSEWQEVYPATSGSITAASSGTTSLLQPALSVEVYRRQ